MNLIKKRRMEEDYFPNLKQNPLGTSGNGSFQFIPEFKAAVKPNNTVSFTGKCFRKYNVFLKFINDNEAELVMEASDHDGILPCYDLFLLADMETFYVKASKFFFIFFLFFFYFFFK